VIYGLIKMFSFSSSRPNRYHFHWDFFIKISLILTSVEGLWWQIPTPVWRLWVLVAFVKRLMPMAQH